MRATPKESLATRLCIGGLCALLLCLGIAPAVAQASRKLISENAVSADKTPNQQIEGACGLGIDPLGEIFVSDYYNHTVDVFNPGGGYRSQILAGASPEGACGLSLS